MTPAPARFSRTGSTPQPSPRGTPYDPPTRQSPHSFQPFDTTHLERELRLTGAGTLRVSAAAAACDGDGVFAACHLYRQEWLVDVRPVTGGPAEIVLDLDG